MNNKAEEFFWNKVQKTKDCWFWIGSKTNNGYGKFSIYLGNYKRKMYSAHRFSYELHFGEISKNSVICHKCDIKNCVNPKHLFSGTQKDNITDLVNKNKHLKGSNVGTSKLTENEVKQIKLKYNNTETTYAKLGKEYNVTSTTIYYIIKNKFWKHV